MATIDASALVRVRRARGLSQRALAEAAGITRQAVGAIESGRMQPSVGIALGLARTLDTTVESLFVPREPQATRPTRMAIASIDGRSVAHALAGDRLAIEPTDSSVPNVFLGGCDLSVGLLARHATVRSRDVRVLWLPMTNEAALHALENGEIHAAVVHGIALANAEHRRAFVRFEIATTEAGWLAGRGNPLGFRGASDFTRKGARLVNRPAGAGARQLLDAQLRRGRVDPKRVDGYDREVAGQFDAGRAIAQGFADSAIGLASVANVFGLDFLPLCVERCALLVPATALGTPEIRSLLDALRSQSYRRDLEGSSSYDVTRIGETIA